jgi:hypothetical protein
MGKGYKIPFRRRGVFIAANAARWLKYGVLQMNPVRPPRLIASLVISILLLAAGLSPAAGRDLKIATYNVSKIGTTAGESTERVFRGLAPDVALLQE